MSSVQHSHTHNPLYVTINGKAVAEIWSIFSEAVTVLELCKLLELCRDTEHCRDKVPFCSASELVESWDASIVEAMGLSSIESDSDPRLLLCSSLPALTVVTMTPSKSPPLLGPCSLSGPPEEE